jgi:hypothetical protein
LLGKYSPTLDEPVRYSCFLAAMGGKKGHLNSLLEISLHDSVWPSFRYRGRVCSFSVASSTCAMKLASCHNRCSEPGTMHRRSLPWPLFDKAYRSLIRSRTFAGKAHDRTFEESPGRRI